MVSVIKIIIFIIIDIIIWFFPLRYLYYERKGKDSSINFIRKFKSRQKYFGRCPYCNAKLYSYGTNKENRNDKYVYLYCDKCNYQSEILNQNKKVGDNHIS